MEPYLPPSNQGVFSIFWNLGLFAKFIVITLVVFSVISWAIIIKKFFDFRKVKKSNDALRAIFNSRTCVTELFSIVQEFPNSPLARLLTAAKKEHTRLLNLNNPNEHNLVLLNASESISKEIDIILEELEEKLGFLATCGSVAPFLGLLGTVWGILSAFLNVRHVPIVTLQTIAPGIADALVTTVVGLLVAIPAVIAYNYFIGQIKRFNTEMDVWQTEIMNDLRQILFSNSVTTSFLNK
ncbi:MAG: MotA/TolQ/ExbB proton channel family protein [candidate division WOR-3 bacterium]